MRITIAPHEQKSVRTRIGRFPVSGSYGRRYAPGWRSGGTLPPASATKAPVLSQAPPAVSGKRPDGYHELETCFFPVPWKDVLEIVPSENQSFQSTGIPIPDDGENIVEKAFSLLNKDFDLNPINVHLHKVVPIGAGLGGGSSDAAFALKLFNEFFKLGLSDEKLMEYAIQLGADCAFFIKNKPMLASGIGEKLSEIDLSLNGRSILMIYPNIHISTKEAYSSIIPKSPEIKIGEILKKPINEWKDLLMNDFEKPLFNSYPILQSIKEKLYEAGASYAAMSGSGSCIFGIFDELPQISFDKDYLIWSGEL